MQPHAAAALTLLAGLVLSLLAVAAARARTPGSLPSSATSTERFDSLPTLVVRNSRAGPMPAR